MNLTFSGTIFPVLCGQAVCSSDFLCPEIEKCSILGGWLNILGLGKMLLLDVCSDTTKVAYCGSRFRARGMSNKRNVPAHFTHLMTPPNMLPLLLT